MPYLQEDLDDNEEEDNEGIREQDVKKQYEEATAVDEDEKDFLVFLFRLSKIEREACILSGSFQDGELGGYEAKVKLLALLDVAVSLRDDLIKSI